MIYEPRGLHGKDKKVIILMLEGGIGDHLLATPLLRGLRKKYPTDQWYLIMIAMYHEVFGYEDPKTKDGNTLICMNPYIDKLYSMRLPSRFYMEWARNADVIYRLNPYILSPQRLGSNHFAETWCTIHEVKMDALVLDYYITEHEDLMARRLYEMLVNPVIVIQPFGAYDPIDHIKATENKDWCDDRWEFIIQLLLNRGYDIIQVGKIGERVFNGVLSFVGHANIRETAAIMKYAEYFISIDSFVMHMAKALNKIGIVLWGRTNPFRVGYMENYNIFKLHSCPEIFCGRPEGALFDMAFDQPYFTPWQCPHRDCMKAITVADVAKGIGFMEQRLQLDPVTYERKM